MNKAPFSDKNWPGIRPWIVRVLSSIVFCEFFVMLAWRTDNGRIIDLTTACIAIPVCIIALLVLIAIIWRIFAKTSIHGALGWLVRFLPLFAVIPIIDLVRTYGNGLVIGPPRLNGLGFLFASFTGGCLPVVSGFSIGMRLGIFSISFGVAMMTWYLTRRWWSIFAGLIFSACSVALFSALSFSLFLERLFTHSGWIATTLDIGRRSTVLLSKGYWWLDPYARFPGGIDAQTSVSSHIFFSSWAVFVLGILLLLFVVFSYGWAKKAIISRLWLSWGTFHVVVCVLIGFVCVWGDRSVQFSGMTGVLSVFLFTFLLLAIRASSVAARDIFFLERDEKMGSSHPLATGEWSIEGATAVSLAGTWYALVVGWVLGWPIFVGVAGFLSVSRLTRDRLWSSLPWASTVFRAIGSACLSAISVWFLTQSFSFSGAIFGAMTASAGYCLFVELFWLPRFYGKKVVMADGSLDDIG